MRYLNRRDAGRQLARVLHRFRGKDTVVLALPRGGIILGAEVAKELDTSLGLIIVKKISHPSYPEYAIGAIAENEQPIYNINETELLDEYWLRGAEARARDLIDQRRELYYDGDFIPPKVENKVVIIVDDGIATGLTMEAAVRAVQNQHARKVIVAVPVATPESIDILDDVTDSVIILDDPYSFTGAVGNHYLEFEQVDDEEVRTLLRERQDEIQQTSQKHLVAH